MPIIKITTDRQVWADGRPHPFGAEVDVSADEAKALVAAGFADHVEAAPRRRRVVEGDNL